MGEKLRVNSAERVFFDKTGRTFRFEISIDLFDLRFRKPRCPTKVLYALWSVSGRRLQIVEFGIYELKKRKNELKLMSLKNDVRRGAKKKKNEIYFTLILNIIFVTNYNFCRAS